MCFLDAMIQQGIWIIWESAELGFWLGKIYLVGCSRPRDTQRVLLSTAKKCERNLWIRFPQKYSYKFGAKKNKFF